MSAWPYRLLRWFALHQREMPWRANPSPYRVWISEIMLQQTRVDTVVPFFERFLARFPDVHALARADVQEVLKSWEGLGYYARARNLHRAAQTVVDEHGGQLPRTYDELRRLPGLGPYTAAAVASIAFGEAVPVVDGNVLRVFARFLGLDDDIRLARTRSRVFRELAPFIEEVCASPGYAPASEMPAEVQDGLFESGTDGASLAADAPGNPAGDFNQAIMEIGALICRKEPLCVQCPLRTDCEAAIHDRTRELPVRSSAKRTPHYDVAVGVIWRGERLLIARRKADQMLGGLWELPGGKREEDEPLEETARREIREETDLDVCVKEPYATVKHAYSHFKITLTAFRCVPLVPDRVEPVPRSADELRWVTLEELDAYPLPRASLLVIEHVRAAERARSGESGA